MISPIISLILLLGIPILTFLISLVLPKAKENLIASVAQSALLVHLACIVFLGMSTLANHLTNGQLDYHLRLLSYPNYTFIIEIHIDQLSFAFLVLSAILSSLVVRFSRVYLHKEEGFKRYFSTILLFYVGLCIIFTANNLDTLFIGWEIVGMSSFLLIAYYRNRILPIKNAIKVYSVYRIGDVCILLSIWMMHHIWGGSILFSEATQVLSQHQDTGYWSLQILGLLLILTSTIKSAQFPFSSWLPRAMEGPTPSSAIFYGAIAVHLGVFLLIRTNTLWETSLLLKSALLLIGIATGVSGRLIVNVQSNAKSQIAYASIIQISWMFIELGLGFYWLAVIHLFANAFLRTYQLLTSPSQVSYLIKEQTFEAHSSVGFKELFSPRVSATLYTLALQEAKLDQILYEIIWKPFKKIGKIINSIFGKYWIALHIIVSVVIGITAFLPNEAHYIHYIPYVCSTLGLSLIFTSYANRNNAEQSWNQLLMYHLWIAIAIYFNESIPNSQLILYLSGIIICYLIGHYCFWVLHSKNLSTKLNQYHGYSNHSEIPSFLMLIACLGIAAFPITPSFIGEDLMLSHIHEDQFLLTYLFISAYILSGISIVRLYGKLYYGSTGQGSQLSPNA